MDVPCSESRIQRSTAAQRVPLKKWAVWSGSPVNCAEPGNVGIHPSSASAEVDECLGDLSLTGSPSWHNAVYQLLSQLPITPFSPTRLSLSPSNDWNLHILNISASPVHTRHHGFDLLRVIAIYMVMQIHTGEFEYISPAGTVLHTAGSWAVGWTNSLQRLRAAVRLDYRILPFSHRR